MKQNIHVGIVGFGLSGRYFFAPFIEYVEGFKLEVVVSSQKEIINTEYPDVEVFSSIDEILADNAIQLVIVASPNYTHFDYAKKILKSGKHVIIEKPFTNSTKEADELIKLAKHKNLMLIPFQNRRWDAEFLTVRNVIEAGILGDVLEFESHFDRYRPQDQRTVWKNENLAGNGVLYDLGPHLIDQALCLFGEPQSVYADLKILRVGGKVVDTFEIHLHYGELKVILKAGVFIKELGPRLIVHGRKGSFVKYGLDQQEMNLRKGLKPKGNVLGTDPEQNYGILHYEENGCDVREKIETIPGNYALYFENVRDAIRGETELNVTAEQGKAIIKVIELAYKSQKQKTVVEY